MNQIIGQQFKQSTNTLFQNNQENSMAFINELVPEELKPTFDIEVFYDPRRTLFKQMSFYRDRKSVV